MSESNAAKIKKISIHKAKPSMILGRDVVLDNGIVLLAKNTMLNDTNYVKLLTSGIENIYVNQGSIEEQVEYFTEKEAKAVTLERQRVPVEERPDFIEFENTVNDKTHDAKKYIHAISNGENVDLNLLFSITDDIMNGLRCKTDFLTYIGFIKETDEHTYHHCVNVSLLCNLFGRWINMDKEELEELTIAGMLHDIGKTKIPNEILNKKGKLTDQEYAIMKKHPIYGYRLLHDQNISDAIKLGALMHHEKMDGTGYPMAVKSERISKLAKIIAICDIYDAMTSNRVYRDKICPFEVIKTFETKAYGELDTHYLLLFLQNIAYTYIGQWAILTGGIEAEVIFINRAQLSRPIVRTEDNKFIDLSNIKDISIESLV
ncbi:MAG: HD-GYP domain-containing protein [Clostridiales bacterium]|jgi:putative nucleotidyltransferase with HDIG domain|nr:HD-GYP domain-containing protein [Clostridiales bacterium]